MNELSLFSGAGGGLLGTRLLGWHAVGYVEWDDYCQRVLAARIEDGYLDPAPIFGDVRAFVRDGYAEAYSGLVDVVTAGFPCQPFSVAGKRAGADDERNMWPATVDVIRAVRPRYALLENVPGLLGSGYFDTVLADLAACGYDARWDCIPAAAVGAPHRRDRLWIVASLADSARDGRVEGWTQSAGQQWGSDAFVCGSEMADPDRAGRARASVHLPGRGSLQAVPDAARSGADVADAARLGWERGGVARRGRDGSADGGEVADADDAGLEGQRGLGRERDCACQRTPWSCCRAHEDERLARSGIRRISHGVAHRVDRLRGLGNGQVPGVVVAAWRLLGGE